MSVAFVASSSGLSRMNREMGTFGTPMPAYELRVSMLCTTPSDRPSAHHTSRTEASQEPVSRNTCREGRPPEFEALDEVNCGDRSVVKDDAQQRAARFEPAVVFDQPELAELVHEGVDAGAG